MKGLELAEKFYKQHGEPMLNDQFPNLLPYLAVGLVGSGSECFGYDDNISRDHDFEPAFCIFLPSEQVVDRKAAFELERAYEKLPREFMGYERHLVSAVGGNRHGVIRISDFFENKVGNQNGILSAMEWMTLPEFSLAEAVNGQIFADHYGQITKIREHLQYFPESVRRKKIAGNLLLMGQAGQYNYPRCLARKDTAAAQLAVIEFAKSAIHEIFLLNKTYLPYYKWEFHSLKALPLLSGFASDLEFLISSNNEDDTAKKKAEIIEYICKEIADELQKQQIILEKDTEMESLAYLVNDTINDNQLRNMHILAAI